MKARCLGLSQECKKGRKNQSQQLENLQLQEPAPAPSLSQAVGKPRKDVVFVAPKHGVCRQWRGLELLPENETASRD